MHLIVNLSIGLVVLALALTQASAAAPPPEVEALMRQLADKDESIRLKAAKELGKLGAKAKDAIPALEKATKDADEDVRGIAKKSLAAIQQAAGGKKPDTKGDDTLATLIKDVKANNTKAKLAAMAKLKEMGEKAKAACPVLAEYGMMSPYPTIRNAANEAFEAIDPANFKDMIDLYYDADLKKRDKAVAAFELKGEDAAAAIPGLLAYHVYLQNLRTENYRQLPPFHTLRAMVKISPADEKVRQMVHQSLAGNFDQFWDAVKAERPPTDREEAFRIGNVTRSKLLELQRSLSTEDKNRVQPLLAGLVHSSVAKTRAEFVAEIGALDIENKLKYSALMTALGSNKTERHLIIDELAKLGKDAKGAAPLLRMLKTDSEDAVRKAADAALKAVSE